ncbi:hypothetical protein G6F62_005737 [Rhizopus arrhizus]|nr:hypothetical protein G6F23_006289 [Rhizopus arrhizus]KAG0758784.1 hypothetical protein G6F24_009545 [Rhizopus arrhizus]KAG0939002.1 hypothetical protein G6F32_009254 [Rhizopus arrhizus]KAG1294504.1 hypothetical protein G6F66_005160 [Rhizopus arrhizus]KAG1339559.1 hypothetical protein G6F62_005737 [Rhizopus arrhizus]
MANCLVSLPTHIFTLQDIVLDSPVWRTNMIHLEDQIDQYEKWLDGFIRYLKSYIESMIKCQQQANNLCKRTFLSGIDCALMDTNMASIIVNKFANTLQSTIAYKTQLITELEEMLLNPLQKLYKQDLKLYKESRKQFEKALDKYETQLNRYFVLSKQKEASALREDAFQMHELRKYYVKQSGDHFIRLISFKTQLEHILVECFSNTINAYIEDIEESRRSFGTLKSKLSGWKQWLDESKSTCDYQLNQMKEKCGELTEAYIQQSTPHRSLKRYSISMQENSSDPLENSIKTWGKQGYLNNRVARSSWTRRWFFLQSGWFGAMTIDKQKGYIMLCDRVRVSECTIKVITESDRRFCFEIICPKSSFYLQAETDEDMQEWLRAIECSIKKQEDDEEEKQDLQALLYPKDLMSFTKDHFVSVTSLSNNSLIPTTSTTTSLLASIMLQKGQIKNGEPAPVKPSNNTSTSSLLSSWGMPWVNTSAEEESLDQQADTCLIWPAQLEIEVIRPELEHYTLDTRHRELRKLFANVPQDEVVLDAFKASYYGQKDDDPQFGYSGVLYLTQKSLWFYSCTLMTQLHLCMIPLEKIQTIKIEKTVNGTWLLLDNMLFGLWCCSTSSDIVLERLKVASSQKTQDIQSLYDTLRNISTIKMNNHVTTSSALYPSVTPLTIQIQQPLPVMKQTSSSSTSNSMDHDEGIDTDSAAHVALKAAYNNSSSQSKNTSSKLKMTTTTIIDKKEEEEEEWPKDLPQPKEQVQCECKDHLDKKEAEIELNMSAKKLFTLLFSEESTIWSQLNKAKEFGEPTMTEWINKEEDDDVIRERTMTYMMPVTNPMVKAKETQVIETQQVLSEQDRLSYVVLVTTKTPNLPYADTFLPSIKYCITYISPSKSKIQCSMGIKWLRSVLVKSMIKSAAMKGMAETINSLLPILQQIQQPQGIKRQKREQVIELTQKDRTGGRGEKETMMMTWSKLTMMNTLLVFICFLLTFYQFRIQHKYQALINHPIHWKGIYLRDLENVTESQIVLGGHVNPMTYELFQQDRLNVIDWKYKWNTREHKKVANINY